jgi:adenylate cyclase
VAPPRGESFLRSATIMRTEHLPEGEPRPLLIDGQTIVTAAVFERPAAERPTHDTIAGVAEWLTADARRADSFLHMFDEFAWRLLAAGLPVLRVSLHSGTLHPQFLGATYLWWRTPGQTQKIMITHELGESLTYDNNPVRRVREGREIMRRRLDGPEPQLDFPVLHDLKARGATEYFALPVPSAFGSAAHMAAFVADRPGGFSERELADLSALSKRLSVIADMNSQRQIAENVLTAYLGPQTGPKVLAGQIRRGSGQAIAAVLWSSDLRGFTRLSDRLPAERVIRMLNELFDLQAKAITAHGGEILKFVGDGLLAIFPVASPAELARAAANALAAANEALAELREQTPPEGEPPLQIVVALHYGTVIYGNVGSADRLDFTVIGPAVNLVSRIEAVAKSRDLPLVVSDDFADAYGEKLTSLGRHQLRGLDQPHELFVPSI